MDTILRVYFKKVQNAGKKGQHANILYFPFQFTLLLFLPSGYRDGAMWVQWCLSFPHFYAAEMKKNDTTFKPIQ